MLAGATLHNLKIIGGLGACPSVSAKLMHLKIGSGGIGFKLADEACETTDGCMVVWNLLQYTKVPRNHHLHHHIAARR